MTNLQRDQADVDKERRDHALTKADIEALADELERVWSARFYGNLGRGVWGFVWRGILMGLIAIAAYGAMEGHK